MIIATASYQFFDNVIISSIQVVRTLQEVWILLVQTEKLCT